jgi:alpha-amylase
MLMFTAILMAGCQPGEEMVTASPSPQATASSLDEVTLVASTLAAPTPVASPAATETPTVPRTVAVHLFEWRWTDIAEECENFLGPRGFAAVQVSPPQEHVVVDGFPWWQRYQPVSYLIESRSGTREEFADMVTRCQAAGVDIYADAVINHMSGMDSGVGIAGTEYEHYNYPGTYGPQDFHDCNINPNDDIFSYRDVEEVQSCELVNLADLDTGSEYVRDRIAAYLNDLISLGVAGFRIDAGKHISAEDLQAIISRLEGDPYIYQEVIDQGGEPIKAADYFATGDVTEFNYSVFLGQTFHSGRLTDLANISEGWRFMPSDKAIVFTDNHDNQRGHGGAGGVVTHKDGRLYDLANVFMLAYPYGYPKLMSSYAFENSDQGPPSDAEGRTNAIYGEGSSEPDCFEEWVCEHRWRPIANMVGFHNHTARNFFVTDWWSNDNDQIAFGRGDAGFVIINREDGELNHTFQTSMSPGTYCNVIEGELLEDGSGCTGPTLTVDEQGQLSLTLPGVSAAAIHVGARLGGG